MITVSMSIQNLNGLSKDLPLPPIFTIVATYCCSMSLLLLLRQRLKSIAKDRIVFAAIAE